MVVSTSLGYLGSYIGSYFLREKYTIIILYQNCHQGLGGEGFYLPDRNVRPGYFGKMQHVDITGKIYQIPHYSFNSSPN